MADLNGASVPKLPRGVKLREDAERGWLLLAPERVLTLDAIAIAVLGEVDGVRSFGEIVDRLAERYAAPRDQIAGDVKTFLTDLIEKRMMDVSP